MSCNDYPLLWDKDASEAERFIQRMRPETSSRSYDFDSRAEILQGFTADHRDYGCHRTDDSRWLDLVVQRGYVALNESEKIRAANAQNEVRRRPSSCCPMVKTLVDVWSVQEEVLELSPSERNGHLAIGLKDAAAPGSPMGRSGRVGLRPEAVRPGRPVARRSSRPAPMSCPSFTGPCADELAAQIHRGLRVARSATRWPLAAHRRSRGTTEHRSLEPGTGFYGPTNSAGITR